MVVVSFVSGLLCEGKREEEANDSRKMTGRQSTDFIRAEMK